MAKKNRDDFSAKTVSQISRRAGLICSYPGCNAFTVGATSDGKGEINIGTAAHICAAASGGPRYDPTMTTEVRSSASNGIWMCRDHGKAIDSCDPEFTVERLREWKRQAENNSWLRVSRREPALASLTIVDEVQIAQRLRVAAEMDLKVFQRTSKWPSTSVPLFLKIDGFEMPIAADALAGALASLDDLIVVAPPGMGKTSTLYQVAERMLASNHGTPIIIPLGDWATDTVSVLDSVLGRPAFKGISEEDFRKVAIQPDIVFLLDGWNELDESARKKARVQIERIKAEMPDLGLVVSTRKQMLDVPLEGTRVDILPLNENQQMQIAIDLCGDSGANVLDQALRTRGIRELVSIPLYLRALLTLPEGEPFPTTKEELLRRFVTVHEKNASHAESLLAVSQGFHQQYLENLAVVATRIGNTTITDDSARRSITDSDEYLVQEGQIHARMQPNRVLEGLVSSHILMRAGDRSGISFQHQQFQEWYASHFVERRIIENHNDLQCQELLKSEIFNFRIWEEAILFAVERLAHGTKDQRDACGKAISAAFEVDPMLAAEMIYRANDEVWALVAGKIQGFVELWHVGGTVDRAARFMLTSGRPEFLDIIWPMITNEDAQICMEALRNCESFRTTILGIEAEKEIRTLPSSNVRALLLAEIALTSGIDGLDLAANIAKDDPDPEVQVSVVDVFEIRRAERHIITVLKNASDATFDLVARKRIVDEVADKDIQQRLTSACKRLETEENTAFERLRSITLSKYKRDRDAEITAIIADIDLDQKNDSARQLIYEIEKQYKEAVSHGLIARLRSSKSVPYWMKNLLFASGLVFEEEDLFTIAMAEKSDDHRAESAASILGPTSIGRMIDAMVEVGRIKYVDSKIDDTASKRFYELRSRILKAPGASIVSAIYDRRHTTDFKSLEWFAELLSWRFGDHEPITPENRFSSDDLAKIHFLFLDWGSQMLAAGSARRQHLAGITKLAKLVPSKELLPLLERMLNEELKLYRAFREEAQAVRWAIGEATNEARLQLAHEYSHAFLAINAAETSVLMKKYLEDEIFGVHAARVLAFQWESANEPSANIRTTRIIEFERVMKRRSVKQAVPTATSEEAESIFTVIEKLIDEGSTENDKKLGINLAIVAARLPHGERKSTVQKLIDLAPCAQRATFLLSLVHSGTLIDISFIKKGLAEVTEDGKTGRGVFPDENQVRDWLRLLPFSNHPEEALSVFRSLPVNLVKDVYLGDIAEAFGHLPENNAEEALYAFADAFPRIVENHSWRGAILNRVSLASKKQVVDMAARGRLNGKNGDRWVLAKEISDVLDDPSSRQQVYSLLQDGVKSHGLALLADAIAENPDKDGILLLLRLEKSEKHSRITWQTIERMATQRVPAVNWSGAYNIVPVCADKLRERLLLLTADGGPSDSAAHCLAEIDRLRDEHGASESEPRHPNLSSGKPWPILISESGALPD